MDYAPEFYNSDSNPPTIYGYSGDPTESECTVFLKKDISLGGQSITLLGSVQKSEDPNKIGREIVMLANTYATECYSPGGVRSAMRFIDEQPITPKIIGYIPFEASQDQELATRLKDFMGWIPGQLRALDKPIHNHQSKRVAAGKGLKKNKFFRKRNPDEVAKEDGAFKYLQFCKSWEYQQSRRREALGTAREAITGYASEYDRAIDILSIFHVRFAQTLASLQQPSQGIPAPSTEDTAPRNTQNHTSTQEQTGNTQTQDNPPTRTENTPAPAPTRPANLDTQEVTTYSSREDYVIRNNLRPGVDYYYRRGSARRPGRIVFR